MKLMHSNGPSCAVLSTPFKCWHELFWPCVRQVQGALSSSERAAFMRILREYQQQSLAQREAAGEAGESTGELAARVLLRPLADFLSAPSRYPLLKG